jgi:hypothetical protein
MDFDEVYSSSEVVGDRQAASEIAKRLGGFDVVLVTAVSMWYWSLSSVRFSQQPLECHSCSFPRVGI